VNILFYTIDPNPARWVETLQQQLPEARIALFPAGREVQADYAVCWKPPADFFDGQHRIKAVFNIAAGVDAILAHPGVQQGYLREVPIVRLGDAGMAAQMEEYVLAAALRWQRKLDTYAAQQRAGIWTMLAPKKRDRMTVGVLGLGVLGTHVAQSMRRFGYQAAGWSRHPKQVEGVDYYHGAEGLKAFLARTNVLVCLLPLTDDTRGILNRSNLAQLPQGAHLVNIGRGAHLVEADLLALLDEGHLGGATLDVFAEEPLLAGSRLWAHPGVLVTPHVSAATLRGESMAQIADKIRALERGEALTDVVDRIKGY
jgi:glyoxylate/hydroxypyruvate reductase A